MDEIKIFTEQLSVIPKVPGVYLMRDSTGKIVYIGKAKNLASRIRSYFVRNEDYRLVSIMFHDIKAIEYIVCGSEKEALILEQKLIKKLQPKYNIIWKDDKSYLMIEIDLNDPFPRLNFVRYKEYLQKIVDKKNKLYFGPYPSSRQIKSVVRWITKFFKIRQCKYNSELFFKPELKDKFSTCIYYQTKQCIAPCVKPDEVAYEYKQLIKNIILFLQGRNKKLVEELQHQMKEYSGKQEYEKAMTLRDTIKYISNIFSKCIIKKINEEDVVEITIAKIDLLKKIQQKFCLRSLPTIIEAVDISTFQGVGSCGSVVRFVNGEPDKNNYRRYKIKQTQEYKVDDYKMLQEVVERRYRRLINEKKPLPNLLIVDGGKGQLTTALKVIEEYKLDDKIDLISIAKNEDEVYTVGREEPIKLTTDLEDNLLRYIRDEAHRFAIKYNKLLLRKKLKI
ncbi:MAG: GIY-YIG nuclease family protein [Endomicrobia bacterium]|nr:GIY-YIG nuclease family protein [Endomicrobiia bacterium]MDW8056093.1 GIY-YIG nuclease family protein [Elusimicrobiota bacterium]